MKTRRSFIKSSTLGALAFTGLNACSSKNTESPTPSTNKEMIRSSQELKISLAQWSLNKSFFEKEIDPVNFAAITRNVFGLNAIEYVNQFYTKRSKDEKFWNQMKKRATDNGITSLLIMTDDEGDLGAIDKNERKLSVENHYKWVNAAALLGCHSIRVNAFGEGDKSEVGKAMVDGLGDLSEYAAKENINILIENHGLYSSDGKWVVNIIEQVGMDNLGTLPDFGNWCLSAKWGSTQKECNDVYDIYQGVSDFLPYAKGVSAKSYSFDEKGQQPLIDYNKMLSIVKESNFDGYIGIEYEGETQSEHEGIKATHRLLETTWDSI